MDGDRSRASGRMVISEGVPLSSAAARFSVSAKTAAKWVGRYQQFGAGMADRSSRPHHSPQQTSSLLVEKVLALRRLSYNRLAGGRELGLVPSTVSRILRRSRLSRWRDLHPLPPVVRYEHPAPGDMLHLDIKGMTRFRRGLGARRRKIARQEPAPGLAGPACCGRRSLAHGLYPDAARPEGRNRYRLPRPGCGVLPLTASACARC